MKMIDIGRVAELTGLTTATIRYYESKGLITPAGRKGLTRIYDEEVLTRLSLTILAKQGLLHIEQCPAENHLACPKFRKILSVSLKKTEAKR